MSEFETVLRTPDLGPGAVAPVIVNGHDIAVANVGQTYYAVEAICPVDGTNLARDGRLVGDQLICPNDNARFDVRTGHRIDETGRTIDSALQPHSVRVEGNEIRVGPARSRH